MIISRVEFWKNKIKSAQVTVQKIENIEKDINSLQNYNRECMKCSTKC